MALYSIARRTTDVTTAHACIEIIAAATPRPKIMEIGIFLAAATASVFGLGRPDAAGDTPTGPIAVLAEDEGDPAGTTTTALAWATSPTAPTQYIRRIALPATIGTGVIWTFPRGLVIPVSGTIVIMNIGATGVADVYVVVEE